jgi:hypothetical protein
MNTMLPLLTNAYILYLGLNTPWLGPMGGFCGFLLDAELHMDGIELSLFSNVPAVGLLSIRPGLREGKWRGL